MMLPWTRRQRAAELEKWEGLMAAYRQSIIDHNPDVANPPLMARHLILSGKAEAKRFYAFLAEHDPKTGERL